MHESTKKKITYQAEILKLKHEKETAEEIMRALHNANFNKTKISSVMNNNNKYRNLILEK